MQDIEYITVHCASTKPSMDIGAAEIDRWHRERGWLKIGYHFVIRRDGTVETGRSLSETGAHVQGYNRNNIGICMVGGLSQDGKKSETNFTDDQWSALAKLVDELSEKYPDARVMGHRDFPKVNKDCPTFDVAVWQMKRGK